MNKMDNEPNWDVIITGILTVILIVLIAMTVAAKAESTFVCCVHKGEYVWIRDIPSKEGNKIGTIRYGYEMKVSEIQNQYAHVTLNSGLEGWVDVSYIEQPIKEEVWVVNCDGPLNKRETPDGRFMTKIKGGSRISVLAWRYSPSGELWAKVYHGGYVAAKYLSKE